MKSPADSLDPLEVAAGFAIGVEPSVPPLPRSRGGSPSQALEDVLARALAAPPCRVSFSGGLDSSLILAAAARTARRRDLPPPIPVTLRFGGLEGSQEDDWQRLMVEHVGLESQWTVLQLEDEVEIIGPHAVEYLAAAGAPPWPWNLPFLMPVARAGGPGGSLVTGVGGDELFTEPAYTVLLSALDGTRRPKLRDLPNLALPFTPWPARGAARLAQERQTRPWLTRRANARLAVRWASFEGTSPIGWDRAMRRLLWPSRYVQLALRSTEVISRVTGVEVSHPLLDPAVVSAVASHLGRSGPRSRASGFEAFEGSALLPEALLHRRTKAIFDGAFWSERCRAFAPTALAHVRPEVRRLVDSGRLQEEWAKPNPTPLAYSILQDAWVRRAAAAT